MCGEPVEGKEMTSTEEKPKLIATISWILYDFADTAYSMNVVSLYFSTWLIIELAQSDLWVSLANSLSMAMVALTMPVLGDWSDRQQKKKMGLFIFTMICIAGTFLIGVTGKSIQSLSMLTTVVLALYVISNYSYQGGLVFYNALLPAVSTPKTLGRVSGYGVGIGYLGSAAGLLIGGLYVDGNAFGLTIPGITAGGRVAAFIPTAFLYLVFALPIFFFVTEPPNMLVRERWHLRESYKQVWKTLKATNQYPGLLRFLVAKFLYEDSIQTIIIFMGVYTQAVMGFSTAATKTFFIMVIPAAVVGSAICGILSDHYGPKKTLVGVIAAWIVSLTVVVSSMNITVFWISGAIVGVLMGSTWTAARPLLISLVPGQRLGEFFGLYALSGKAAAITGPLLWSSAVLLFAKYGNIVKYKSAVAVLVVVMAAGLIVLLKVPDLHQQLKWRRQDN